MKPRKINKQAETDSAEKNDKMRVSLGKGKREVKTVHMICDVIAGGWGKKF